MESGGKGRLATASFFSLGGVLCFWIEYFGKETIMEGIWIPFIDRKIVVAATTSTVLEFRLVDYSDFVIIDGFGGRNLSASNTFYGNWEVVVGGIHYAIAQHVTTATLVLRNYLGPWYLPKQSNVHFHAYASASTVKCEMSVFGRYLGKA
jgi:hypothetical protein